MNIPHNTIVYGTPGLLSVNVALALLRVDSKTLSKYRSRAMQRWSKTNKKQKTKNQTKLHCSAVCATHHYAFKKLQKKLYDSTNEAWAQLLVEEG